MSEKKDITREWWRGAVIYQIYPRSFMDTTGNGIGDLRGIINNMDYIADLGVDAVWLTPFLKSPMKDFGYDVSDFREVDPLFGTRAEFEELIAEAHARHIRIIMDIVVNHTSDQHPWFRESKRDRANPKADWYVWAPPREDGTAPNNWLARFGGPGWTFMPQREQYYYHGFLPEQPDLNFHCKAVQDAVYEELKFWLDEGIDGLRLDACNHFFQDTELRDNPPRPRNGRDISEPYAMQSHVYDRTRPENIDFLRRIRALTDQYPERFVVAEVGDDNGIRTSARYVEAEGLLHTAYCFSMLEESPYAPETFRAPVEEFNSLAPHGWPAWSFSNHDAIRPVTRWGGEDAAHPVFAKQLQALLLCLRGTLFMYQGQELGLPEANIPYEKMQDPMGKKLFPLGKGRDGCRTPMPWTDEPMRAGFTAGDPWLPIPDEHLALAVDIQASQEDSMLAYTRRFLAWRRRHDVLKYGDIAFFNAPENFLAFRRGKAGEDYVVCVFCLSRVGGVLPQGVLPAGYEDGHDIVPPAALPKPGPDGLVFPPYGFLIAERGGRS